MHPRGFIPFLILLLGCGAIDASQVSADIVCPDSSYATVQFTRTFTGVYRPGQPRDVVTVGPGGIETFTEAGIIIRVYLKSCSGAPIVGLPRQEVVLFHPNLCLCPGGNIADAATDANGATSFSGALQAGKCAPNLTVYADGVAVGTLPIQVNSPDNAAFPCSVEADDRTTLAIRYGTESGVHPSYTICSDFNEDGFIDLSDAAFLGRFMGTQCPGAASAQASGRQP